MCHRAALIIHPVSRAAGVALGLWPPSLKEISLVDYDVQECRGGSKTEKNKKMGGRRLANKTLRCSLTKAERFEKMSQTVILAFFLILTLDLSLKCQWKTRCYVQQIARKGAQGAGLGFYI